MTEAFRLSDHQLAPPLPGHRAPEDSEEELLVLNLDGRLEQANQPVPGLVLRDDPRPLLLIVSSPG